VQSFTRVHMPMCCMTCTPRRDCGVRDVCTTFSVHASWRDATAPLPAVILSYVCATMRAEAWARPCVRHAVDGGWLGGRGGNLDVRHHTRDTKSSRGRAKSSARCGVAANTHRQRITLAWLHRLTCGGCEADGGFDRHPPAVWRRPTRPPPFRRIPAMQQVSVTDCEGLGERLSEGVGREGLRYRRR